jgi:hypothetical protein
MRLYEFAADPIVTSLVAVVDQLQTDLDSGEVHSDWTVPELLAYFRDYDILLDKTDLYNMIQVPPLNSLIQNIQGDNVIFKGQTSAADQPEDEKKKIVKSMANHAAQQAK